MYYTKFEPFYEEFDSNGEAWKRMVDIDGVSMRIYISTLEKICNADVEHDAGMLPLPSESEAKLLIAIRIIDLCLPRSFLAASTRQA
jgi:hypothetical protein